MSNAIQIAVARADLVLCRIAALPWGIIGLSVLIAAVVVYVCHLAIHERRDAD